MTTVVMEWKGPYSLVELKGLEAGNGFYLLTGRQKASRALKDALQYCGITEQRFCKRINESHEKVKLLRPETVQVWIGCPMYPIDKVRQHLEDAESAFVSFWAVKMNTKKRKFYPGSPICIVSRWHKKDGSTYKRWPAALDYIKKLDDVLWWDTNEWRTGDLTVR